MPSLPPIPSFHPRRRLAIGSSVLASIISVLTLAFLANYLAHHYAPRHYWGASRDYRLSALSLGALETLTNQVRITAFFDRDHPVYPSVRALLREYAAASPRLHIDELDYSRNPAAAQEFRRRFPYSTQDRDPDLVLFESGPHTKAVLARDLRDYDVASLARGAPEALPTAFKGERLFTSAINAVAEGRPRRAYFLQGHREHDPSDDAPQAGYRQLVSLLEEDHIEIQTFTLAHNPEIPRDCELLVIAGPRDPLAPAELQAIDRFLRRGGRLFVLFQYRAITGLESLLASWGVRASDSLVLDRDNSDQGVLIVSRFGNHPVTRPLGNSQMFLFAPRAVEPSGASQILGAPARIDTLLLTGTNGVAATSFAGGTYRLHPDDPRGSIPIAVAVERGLLPGVATHLGTTRIIAVGDSRFLANQLLQVGGNRHFAALAVNWLLDRSHLLGGIPPTPIHSYQVRLTPFQHRMLRVVLLGILPGGALALGLLVWWRRH